MNGAISRKLLGLFFILIAFLLGWGPGLRVQSAVAFFTPLKETKRIHAKAPFQLLKETSISHQISTALDRSIKLAPDLAVPGDPLTYTLILYNDSTTPLTETWVYDPLPDEVNYVSGTLQASAGNASFADHEITWIGDLNPGLPITVTFVTIIDINLPETKITNTATITHPLLPNSLSLSAGTRIQRVKLNATYSASLQQTSPGNIFTYTFQIHNQGIDSSQLVITDTLPPCLHAERAWIQTTSGTITSTDTPQQIIWTLNLPSQSNAMLLYSVQTAPDCALGTRLNHVAYVDDGIHPLISAAAPSILVDNYYLYFPIVLKPHPCSLLAIRDNFNDSASGWPIINKPSYLTEYRDGEYRIQLKTPFTVGLAISNYRIRPPFEISVDARQIGNQSAHYGIVFGVNSEQTDFYILHINLDTQFWGLIHCPNGINNCPTIHAAYSSAILRGNATNHIKILQENNQFTGWINNQKLATFSNVIPNEARNVGLFGGTPVREDPPADVRFDNFEVNFCIPQDIPAVSLNPIIFPGDRTAVEQNLSTEFCPQGAIYAQANP